MNSSEPDYPYDKLIERKCEEKWPGCVSLKEEEQKQISPLLEEYISGNKSRPDREDFFEWEDIGKDKKKDQKAKQKNP